MSFTLFEKSFLPMGTINNPRTFSQLTEWAWVLLDIQFVSR
jgi:hypothetical protein